MIFEKILISQSMHGSWNVSQRSAYKQEKNIPALYIIQKVS